MSKIKAILEELVKNCSYRHNVSPNNYLLYKEESISTALLALKSELLACLPKEEDICYSKINMGFADSREYRQEGWNECLTETKAKIEEMMR